MVSTIFHFHPLLCGNDSQFDFGIFFQFGWRKNHQLESLGCSPNNHHPFPSIEKSPDLCGFRTQVDTWLLCQVVERCILDWSMPRCFDAAWGEFLEVIRLINPTIFFPWKKRLGLKISTGKKHDLYVLCNYVCMIFLLQEYSHRIHLFFSRKSEKQP